MRYKWIHECQHPEFKPTKETVLETRGWGPFKRQEEIKYDVWEEITVRWNCPDCQSQWEYHNSYKYTPGFWMCIWRPEVWKDYEG